MGSSLSKPESSLRKWINKWIDRLIKRKLSGETTPAPASSGLSSSPQPITSLDPNTGSTAGLAPPPVPASPRPCTPAPATPARVPSPAPCNSPPAKSAAQSLLALSANPTQTASPTGVWSVLDTSLRALHKSTGVFPSVQSAELAENNDDRQELASELTSLSNLMVRHMKQSNSTGMSEALESVARGIREQVEIIESQRNRGAGRRFLEASADEEALNRCYRRITSLFRELQADASLSMWKVIHDQAANTQLDRLKPVHLAKYDSALSTSISRRSCTEGTRTAILSGLKKWSRDPTQPGIYWMNGMAGTGKTTIACTFSEWLEQRERLAASFFCTRTTTECRGATRILPSIAYQLARRSSQFRSALYDSLQCDPDIITANITKQYNQLLKEPLVKIKDAMPSHMIVVIDALDECDNTTEVELLLSTLAKGATGLPLKFFVTSRPEPGIYNRMMTRDRAFRDVLHLHEVEKSLVQADIRLYLQTELEPMSPASPDIQELVQRSGTLFIYAATLVRYIEPDKLEFNPKRRLQSVLSMTWISTTEYSAIDALYLEVLKSALNKQGREAAEVGDVPVVLRTVLCAKEPLSIESLTEMAQLNDKARTSAALQRLRAVVHVSEVNGLVSTLHASFPDFMFDEARSHSYCYDQVVCNEVIARRCFEIMGLQLRFNICNLDSSFTPDTKVEHFEEKISNAISPALFYACMYWADHLNETRYCEQLSSQLEIFLSNQLLFWMEVMNLKRKIGIGLKVLAKASFWTSRSTTSNNITRYVEDARKFVSSFAPNPVSQSTPHIYISALPFCPKSSFVFKQYCKRMRGLTSVAGSTLGGETAVISSWVVESEVYCIAPSPDGSGIAYGCKNGAVAIRSAIDGMLIVGPLEGHTDSVYAIAYSPDGSRLATGSDDKTICIWKVEDGTLVGDPLEGHTKGVVSVAYSPGDNQVASGSDDHTIRVWDTRDGTLISGPLEGHTSGVFAVAYSPDGRYIVSGSADNTIRIWNARSGSLIAGPLQGHTGSVRSIAYSPDGAYIVSGSYDKTLRVWNASDGMQAAAPLKGHTSWVRSVAYSSDGTRIISGSGDNTLRVWSAQDGSLVAGPLEGHTQGVTSVAYSPDGTRIISGAYDSTIRVWEAQTDISVAKKPDSHTGSVNAVIYSPDGSHIVSGSSDHSIRIWHAKTGSLIAGPLEGHTKSVTSVAYSPAGSRIVSGSDDHAIRVWNSHDGALVVGPLEGHTDSVRSVGYSPDSTCIVSGSNDGTIRVWDAEDGTLVAGPLKDHTDWVTSVVYSPDSTHIASASFDRTIRVWNAQDNTFNVGLIVVHNDFVTSVAYSPDSTRIASGSNDKTVRVWDANNGTLVAGPFEGHTDYIYSVGYSPDGTRIASGSWDKTIRVWNAQDGTLVAGPFGGHTDWVRSVTYSPDGTHIASGSDDQTIRVWSALDGVPASSSLVEGHRDPETIDFIVDGASTDSSGWVTASDSRLLLWVPPELQPRGALSGLRSHMVIGPAGTLLVECEDLVLGRRWVECYQP